MFASWARCRLCFIRNLIFTFPARFKHQYALVKNKIRSWLKGITTFLVVILMLLASPVQAGDISYGHVQAERITSVYDGDTFRADIAGWPAIIGTNIPVRVAGIDMPEINGKCEYERNLAIQARDAAAAILSSGQPVVLGNIRRGKYFRIIADVWVGNARLADTLIRSNLGRPYNGGRRRGWC